MNREMCITCVVCGKEIGEIDERVTVMGKDVMMVGFMCGECKEEEDRE